MPLPPNKPRPIFIAAGQRKYLAFAQQIRHFLSRPPPEKLNALGNAEVCGQRLQSVQLTLLRQSERESRETHAQLAMARKVTHVP